MMGYGASICLSGSKRVKIPIDLAGCRKTLERFPAYLIEGSTDKHQLYLKPCGLRPEKIALTGSKGDALRASNAQELPKGKTEPKVGVGYVNYMSQTTNFCNSAICASPQ